MSQKNSLFSTLFSILGVLLFYISSFGEKGIIGIYFFTGIALWTISVYFGVKGFRVNEKGFPKYIGIGIISLLIVGYGAIIILMGIRGFGA